MKSDVWQKLALCLVIGLGGALATAVPAVLDAEEMVGLDWLFRLRGPIPAPDEVAVISIDVESAAALGLRVNPDRWPRSLHAELIERLTAVRVAVIVFDIIFDSPREETGDRELADAIREAGNVVLLERLRTRTLETGQADQVMRIEERVLPIPSLESAALATGPFPLPRVPFKVSQFWTFGPADPTVLTLPSAALHAYALDAQDDFLELLERVESNTGSMSSFRQAGAESSSLARLGAEVRALLRSSPEIIRELTGSSVRRPVDLPDGAGPQPGRAKLDALIGMYAGTDSRYLNFYGPARTIETIPYHSIVSTGWDASTSDLAGKVAFVGFSEQNTVDQQDIFYTVFSERSGANLSGAEIGATAFANLLHGTSVRPLSIAGHLALVTSWGIVLAAMLVWLPTRFALASVGLSSLAYFVTASSVFRLSGLWLPIVVPLLGQVPVALLVVFGWKYARARAQGEQAKRTLGFYLPPEVVEQLSRETSGTRPQPRLLHGTCLVTDVEQYTELSERLSPTELHGLINDYYAVLFAEVESCGGFIADITGDSMVAVWAGTTSKASDSTSACRAAVAILYAVDEFNRGHAGRELPTRIGMHSGQLLLGDVGGESHFEYRAVGDLVNTASRIQGLNKRLQTSLLVSDDVLRDAHVSFSRPLGKFVLAGKSVPLMLHDMVSFESSIDADSMALSRQFASALDSFYSRQWRIAEQAFERLLEQFPRDGPSAFYLARCREYRAVDPGSSWQGAVVVSEK